MLSFLNKKYVKTNLRLAIALSSLHLLSMGVSITSMATEKGDLIELHSDSDFVLKFEVNNNTIEVAQLESVFVLKIFDFNGNKIDEKYVDREKGIILNEVVVSEGVGFALITEDIIHDNNEYKFNALIFNADNKHLDTKKFKDINRDEIITFIETLCAHKEPINEDLSTLSQNEVLKKAEELIKQAELTLSELDIEKAQSVIHFIKDNKVKSNMIEKLNEISMKFIEKESYSNNELMSISQEVLAASEITLSTSSNQIVFNDLKVGVDTIIPNMFSVNVVSLLPYDINLKIEDDIISSGASNLNKSFFEAKLSTSSTFLSFENNNLVNILSNGLPGTKSYNIDLKLKTSKISVKDTHKVVFKIEAVTK